MVQLKYIYIYKMGKKLIGSLMFSGQFIVTIIIFSILYTYFYPWIYNKVNHFTERGQDLDDKIDIINTMIMSAIVSISFMITGIVLGGAGISATKYKKSKK